MNKPMNQLEQYLQQVCRSMGGPRALREHVRQELREHLLDAASQHQAAGLSEEAAMDRAMQEFGQPEVVRSELEATHGHRMMMAMVLDKALEWKEKTMKAKWLWTTWTYLMVVGVIALEIFFLFFQFVYIIPKIKKLKSDGYFAINERTDSTITGIHDLLDKLINAADQITWWMILLIAAIWGLFEWRVKSENKTFIRLSVLGTAALGLLVAVVLLAGSLILIPVLAVPGMRPVAHAGAMESMTLIDKMTTTLDLAMAKPDWDFLQQQSSSITSTLKRFPEGPMLGSLAKWDEGRTLENIQTHWKAIQEAFEKVHQAIQAKDAAQAQQALKAFRASFDSFQELVKRPVKPKQ
ncbi:MAG TPA: permease prefix domain 1-containing protein [Gemmatales bacterium]|nr:permease prefix domain 1-containing protein [Gemmatales bacterium]